MHLLGERSINCLTYGLWYQEPCLSNLVLVVVVDALVPAVNVS